MGGTIVYDSSVVKDPPPFRAGVHVFGVPFTEIAVDLGKAMVKNIVALGRSAGRDEDLPRGDVPDGAPPGPEGQVRADSR